MHHFVKLGAEAQLHEAIKAGVLEMVDVRHGLLEIGRKLLFLATTGLSNLAENEVVCSQDEATPDQSNTVDSGCSSLATKEAQHQ